MEPFLKLDHPLIDVVNAIFIIRKQIRIHKSVQPSELSCDIQLEIDVDAFLFQFRKEIVETFELHRFDKRVENRIASFWRSVADVVHTHDVYSVAGEFPGQFIGGGMVGEASRHTYVGADKANRPTGFVDEKFSCRSYETLRPHTPAHSGPGSDICDILRRIVGRPEWKHGRKVARSFDHCEKIGIGSRRFLGMKIGESEHQRIECQTERLFHFL